MLFRAVEKNTNSIPKTLLEFSKAKNIELKFLDFDISSFATFLTQEGSEPYKIESDLSLAQLQDPTLEITQTYTINIIPMIKRDESVSLSLAANKSKLRAAITVKKGSVFKKSTTLLKDLKNDIWKKKLRAGFLIDIFEDNLDTQLQKLLNIVPYSQALEKDLKFTVASGLIPDEPIDAKLEKFYEKKNVESKSLISGIDKGELVATYTLPKSGTQGRACNGKFIPIQEASIIDKQPTIDGSIREDNLGHAIEYYAQVDGYPVVSKDKLFISNNLQLSEATFKSTAVIDSGNKDLDISVNINHDKTHNEDAIGSGVKIDVKELNVDGSIASNVHIATDSLNVDAQTHSKSTMAVQDKATIKLHRGNLTAKIADIDILESGKVTATESVTIRQMLGGTVIAPVVKVDEVLANTTIIASELIEVKSILGEHNKLIIDPDSIQSYHDRVQLLKDSIEAKKISLKEEIKNFEKKTQDHHAKIDRIKVFQKRVLDATKAGKTPMKQDILRVKQFKKDSDRLTLEKERFPERETEITNDEAELYRLCNKDLYAKIKSNTIYDGHTKVIFVNILTREELFIIPKGKSEEIFLKLNEDNERVISIS